MTEKNSLLLKKRIDELNNVAESMSAKDALVAFESANEALELSKSINYKKGQVYACHYLAESLYRQGKIYDSIETFMQALNINVNPVDELIQSMIFTSLGNAHLYLKFYDLAFHYYRNALVLSEKLERHESSAMIYNNIGEIYRELGDFNNALNSYNSCLEICRLNNLKRVEMYATTNIGVTNYQTKHYQDAIVYLEKSLKESKEKNDQIIEGFSNRYLGLIYLEMKEYQKAKAYFILAMNVYINTNETISQARINYNLAELEVNEKNYQDAFKFLHKARELAEDLQDKKLISKIYLLLSKAYELTNDFEKACKYYDLSNKARDDKESQEYEHKLRSVNFQINAWEIMKESENYQKLNQELQIKTERLEKVTKELQKINKEVKALSDMDGLTRIANRIKLDGYAQEVYSKAYKNKKNLTVMIIDIDNFKEYNDFYGHLVGDEALKKLAKILEKSVSKLEGLAARFGGDEFVLMIYDMETLEALKLAKSISKSLLAKKIKHEKSKVHSFLTISVGLISKIPSNKESYALMMDFADQALYQAKEKGRNQVEVY